MFHERYYTGENTVLKTVSLNECDIVIYCVLTQ